jgi:hypothetical protein
MGIDRRIGRAGIKGSRVWLLAVIATGAKEEGENSHCQRKAQGRGSVARHALVYRPQCRGMRRPARSGRTNRLGARARPLRHEGQPVAQKRRGAVPDATDWVTIQSEYSKDVLFRKRADMDELMPRLCHPCLGGGL